MKTLALLTWMILQELTLCSAEEINRDAVAQKFSYHDWKHFLEEIPTSWDWTKANAAEFTPAEAEFLLNLARERERIVPKRNEVNNVWFSLRLKFSDPKAIELLESYFARGWYWAADAEEALSRTGELSLIPSAGKYLWVQEPSEPEPKMDDFFFTGHLPSVPRKRFVVYWTGVTKRLNGSKRLLTISACGMTQMSQYSVGGGQRTKTESEKEILFTFQARWNTWRINTTSNDASSETN